MAAQHSRLQTINTSSDPGQAPAVFIDFKADSSEHLLELVRLLARKAAMAAFQDRDGRGHALGGDAGE